MENKDNQELRTAFWLLGPLIFYELCMQAAGLACSLFGTQDAMAVTGGGALLVLPFLYAAYRRIRHAGNDMVYDTYRIIVCCRKYNWAAAKKLCGLDAELLADMYKV